MKKSSVYKRLALWLMTVSLFAASSCTRRDLEMPPTEMKVNITFDWEKLHTKDTIPHEMVICFYKNDQLVFSKECSGDGFSGVIPCGLYQVLAYNKNVVNAEFRNIENYTTAAVYALEHKKEYITEPMQVYAAGIDSFEVTGFKEVTQRMRPVPYVKNANLNLEILGQSTAVASCVFTIDGLVRGVYLSSGQLIQGQTGLLEVTPVVSPSGYNASMTFFGREKSSASELNSVFSFAGGGNQEVAVDITSSIMDEFSTEIIIDIYIKVEISGTEKGGFVATLKDWKYGDREVIVK